MKDVVELLRDISTPPPRGCSRFDEWLNQTDAFAFLRENLSDREFVLYVGHRYTYIYAIAVQVKSLDPLDPDDIMRWSANPTSSWSIASSFGDAGRVWIEPPLADAGSKVLATGEQLIFSRSFEGRQEHRRYVELLQKLSHLFDLHYVPERNAYCKYDKRGDIEDIVRIICVPGEGDRFGWTVVTIDRAALDTYLALTDAAIIRVFDFTRPHPDNFHGWNGEREEKRVDVGDLHYRACVDDENGSYSRGFQVVRSKETKEKAYKRMWSSDEEAAKQYASFIADDWKNKAVGEISCDPRCLSNYFTKSDKPFEVTPAFFRPDVLLKYKKDPEKYILEDRSITARNYWHLKTYDTNEAGQVHTYLIYLSHLPYEEQLYWKSFNEAPKAAISRRAYATDFQGEVYDQYDPLSSLRYALREFNSKNVPWWKLRSGQLIEQVHYPATKSSEEWADELMALDKLLVEGFEEKWLRSRATELGRSPEIRLRSLKLVEECLVGLNFEEERARQITAPLHEVHNYRSQLKGHATGGEASKIRAAVLSRHGTYRKHFETLCATCDESIRAIGEAFGVKLDY
jgi:hypothetical protein